MEEGAWRLLDLDRHQEARSAWRRHRQNPPLCVREKSQSRGAPVQGLTEIQSPREGLSPPSQTLS